LEIKTRDLRGLQAQMKNANKKLIYADLTYKVRGAVFNVYNTLGSGHKEQVYQKALAKELEEINIPYKREVPLTVQYKGERVGNYRPDFVVETSTLPKDN